MTGGTEFIELACSAAYLNLSASIFLVFFRIVRGPSLPDRVVALDLLAILTVGFVSLYAITSGQPVYLDAAITLALIAFLSTVAFARSLQQTGKRNGGGRR